MNSKYHDRWSDEETATARALLSRSAPASEFIEVIGRSRKAAMARIRSIDFPRARTNDERLQRAKVYGSIGNHVNARMVIPEAVQIDAQKRRAADRSLTATIFGDPAPGDSALDKRGEHH